MSEILLNIIKNIIYAKLFNYNEKLTSRRDRSL